MRIVTLLPSATEIVYVLGLGEALAGVSHDCDYPEDVRSKPVLSQSAVPLDVPSKGMDEAVKGRIHSGLSVYHIDADLLNRLKPDLILTQELCEVCAPSYSEVLEAAKVLDAAPKIVSLEPTCLADILENIRLVGELTGRQAQAEALITELQTRIDKVAKLAGEAESRPRVFCMEWLEPAYCAGHWVPEMVRMAGGEDGLGKPGEPSYEIAWDEVLRYAPEVIVLMPCGFHPDRALGEIDTVLGYEGWAKLPAVRNGQVFIVDGSSYFNRPGPRIVTGLEILAQIIHPEIFSDLVPPGSLLPLS
ncbi:MAG: cobalamin-binding protein [Candidatus Bipolaricaulia bacterium]